MLPAFLMNLGQRQASTPTRGGSKVAAERGPMSPSPMSPSVRSYSHTHSQQSANMTTRQVQQQQCQNQPEQQQRNISTQPNHQHQHQHRATPDQIGSGGGNSSAVKAQDVCNVNQHNPAITIHIKGDCLKAAVILRCLKPNALTQPKCKSFVERLASQKLGDVSFLLSGAPQEQQQSVKDAIAGAVVDAMCRLIADDYLSNACGVHQSQNSQYSVDSAASAASVDSEKFHSSHATARGIPPDRIADLQIGTKSDQNEKVGSADEVEKRTSSSARNTIAISSAFSYSSSRGVANGTGLVNPVQKMTHNTPKVLHMQDFQCYFCGFRGSKNLVRQLGPHHAHGCRKLKIQDPQTADAAALESAAAILSNPVVKAQEPPSPLRRQLSRFSVGAPGCPKLKAEDPKTSDPAALESVAELLSNPLVTAQEPSSPLRRQLSRCNEVAPVTLVKQARQVFEALAGGGGAVPMPVWPMAMHAPSATPRGLSKPVGNAPGNLSADDNIPAVWKEHISTRTGQKFWHNTETNETTWYCPVKTKEPAQQLLQQDQDVCDIPELSGHDGNSHGKKAEISPSLCAIGGLQVSDETLPSPIPIESYGTPRSHLMGHGSHIGHFHCTNEKSQQAPTEKSQQVPIIGNHYGQQPHSTPSNSQHHHYNYQQLLPQQGYAYGYPNLMPSPLESQNTIKSSPGVHSKQLPAHNHSSGTQSNLKTEVWA